MRSALAFAVSLLFVIAGDVSAHPKKSGAFRTSTLVQRLRSSGLNVAAADTIQQPFFSPKARVYRVEGDDLQVYEYKSAASSTREASRVSPNGAIGTSMPNWIAPPHFFRKDRVIAIYLGSNAKVLDALTKAMGPQFAGR